MPKKIWMPLVSFGAMFIPGVGPAIRAGLTAASKSSWFIPAVTAGGQMAAGAMAARGATGAARVSSEAAVRAAEIEAESQRQALEYLKAVEAQRRQDFLAREARLTPYRQFALAAAEELSHRMGLPFAPPPPAAPAEMAPMRDTSREREQFFGLIGQRERLSPEELERLEPQLQAMGWSLVRNAAGRAGKVRLPTGEVIDVIRGAGAGLNEPQWLPVGAAGPAPPPVAERRMPAPVAQPQPTRRLVDIMPIPPREPLPPRPFGEFWSGTFWSPDLQALVEKEGIR